MLKYIAKIFGTKSEKDIKKLMPIVQEINREYSKLESLSHDELRARTGSIQEQIDNYLKEIDDSLKSLDSDETALSGLLKAEAAAKSNYQQAAEKLSNARKSTAATLANKVMDELAPLKMESTRFQINISPLETDSWAEHGMDNLQFEATTNPGVPFGPLAKIASGGELSRFMLALKVVLAENDKDKTLIFDEIDTGTSGAVAEAIGERLSRLGKSAQVMVITHLAQVASKGISHFKVAKYSQNEQTRTTVTALDEAARSEELATMISGQTITDEARKMADMMLKAAS